MAVDIRNNERRRYISELQVQAREKEIEPGLVKLIQHPDECDQKIPPEADKRMRREIANSNERRRMQCINAGFSSLRALIPQLEGEKLSKAAILQHTTDYIDAQAKEKARLQMQVEQLKSLLDPHRVVGDYISAASPPPSKRKKRDTESSDEGVGSLSDGSDEGGTGDSIRAENKLLQHRLETQHRCNATLEERNRILENQLATLITKNPHIVRDLPNLQPVKVEAVNSVTPLEPMYSHEVVEVIASRDTHTPEHSSSFMHPPRPLSPTPERGMAMDVSTPPMDMGSVTFTSGLTYPTSSAQSPIRPTPTMMMTPPQEMTNSVSFKQDVTVITAESQETPPRVPYHHNYCHRDHPRRRHRQQAQMEEDLRRQLEEQHKQQQHQSLVQPHGVNTNAVFRPKSSAQNLEILSEAIRQIEGDNVLRQIEGDNMLCQIESERLMSDMYLKREPIPAAEESERENSGVSDMEEHGNHGNNPERRLENSGRNSPVNHFRIQSVHQPSHQSVAASMTTPHLQQPVIVSSMAAPHLQPIIVSSPALVSPSISAGSNVTAGSFSEKYPNMATHLLNHQPIHPSYYNRPGVIVSKHQ